MKPGAKVLLFSVCAGIFFIIMDMLIHFFALKSPFSDAASAAESLHLGDFLHWIVMLVFFGVFGVLVGGIMKRRFRAEEELRKSDARNRAILESAVDAVITIGEDGIVESFNPSASRIFGYSKEEIVGKKINLIMPEPHRSGHDDYILRYIKSGEDRVIGIGREVTGLRKDGAEVPLFLSVSEVETGGRRMFTGILRDVTDQKRTDAVIRESNAEIQAIYDVLVDGMLIAETTSRSFLRANVSVCRMFGYTEEELFSMGVPDLHPPEHLPWISDQFLEMAKGERQISPDIPCIRKDGTVFYSDIAARPITFRGRPCLIGFFRDVTEKKETEDRLRLAARFFESSNEGIVITEPDGSIVDVNAAYCGITGYLREDVIGKNPRIMKSGRHDAEFYRNFWRSLKETGQWQGEIWDRRKNGEIYPKWLSVSSVKNLKGETSHFIGFFSDITLFKQTEERLRHIAHFDMLTGLPNRFLFQDRLFQAIMRSARQDTLVALFFIDLDRFKDINDTLGHQAGDRLLEQVGNRIKACVRDMDTIARLGGDEFTVILPDLTSTSPAVPMAKKIIDSIARPFMISGHEVFVTASIGITFYPMDGMDIDVLTKNADRAMYHAKEAGKNNFQFFREEMNARVFERLSIESGLRRAIERQEFLLHYQPRVDLRTGRITGMEALIRWTHPSRGLVYPGEFIPVAEDAGIITQIGEWVIQEALSQGGRWEGEGLGPFRLSVNFSARQFHKSNLVELVRNALSSTGISPSAVEVEVTESAIMHNVEETARILAELKNLGVTVAIDDFGIGYSSLSYLKRFPIDILKIDQTFVRHISTDSDDAAITLAIIALAHSLNMKVIAEGVETEEQLEFLRANGCDEVQGYLFARPMPSDEFGRLLKSNPIFGL